MILNYKEYGEGDKVLIIAHGLFGSLDNWSTLGRRFAENRRVILVDQRNHGHSFHADEMNYTVMAQDLVDLMDHLSIPEAQFIGHSMGGKTVMKMAMIAPERMSRMIVADIAPKAYPPHHDLIFEAIHALDLDKVHSRGEAEDVISHVLKDRGTLLFLLKNLYWKEKGQLAWRMNLPVIEAHMEDILNSVGLETVMTPTLFIRGSQSKYIQAEDEMPIHFQFPMGELITMQGVGHWLHAEDPETFYALAEDFLD